MEMYQNKERVYYTNARYDLISLIPRSPNNKVLEIGAGGGDTLVAIKEGKFATEVVGFELSMLADSEQNNKVIDKFVFGNIEEMEIPFPENYFDVIICGDVLEHLVDPWEVIKKLTNHLAKGGVFIVSIPNIRIRKALTKIYLSGDFSYEDAGTFDRTHLRFFCKKNMVELLSSDRLKVQKAYPNFIFNKSDRLIQVINKITFRLFEEFLALQYLIISERIK